MKTAVILGTRPEIIKLSPIIRILERSRIDYFILHTGQHYSYNMDQIFFSQLRLPDAKFNLDVGSGSHAEQTGKSKFLLKIPEQGYPMRHYRIYSNAFIELKSPGPATLGVRVSVWRWLRNQSRLTAERFVLRVRQEKVQSLHLHCRSAKLASD